MNLAYTWSRAFGICCDNLSDNPPQVQAMDYFKLNEATLNFDRPHNFQASVVAELPFGHGKPFLNDERPLSSIVGGWQVMALLSVYSGLPFSVSSAGTSLNLPNSTQMADKVKTDVQILGGIGAGTSWFDPLAFRAVTEARFGNAGYNTMRGPGFANLDLSVQRQFMLSGRLSLQARAEIFNLTNTPHFANPNANVSNLQLNADGTVRNLGGFSSITTTANSGRDGIDERVVRLGLRLGF